MEMGILTVLILMLAAVVGGMWVYYQLAAFEAKQGGA